jgi:hypothetical protein
MEISLLAKDTPYRGFSKTLTVPWISTMLSLEIFPMKVKAGLGIESDLKATA